MTRPTSTSRKGPDYVDMLQRASAGIATIQAAINTIEQATSEAGGIIAEDTCQAAIKLLHAVNQRLLRHYDRAKARLQ